MSLLRKTETKIFVFSVLFLFSIEFYLQRFNAHKLFGDFYFQMWPSDSLMQTLNIRFLQSHGLDSFTYLHIQPPLFDALRLAISKNYVSAHSYVQDTNLDLRLYLFMF